MLSSSESLAAAATDSESEAMPYRAGSETARKMSCSKMRRCFTQNEGLSVRTAVSLPVTRTDSARAGPPGPGTDKPTGLCQVRLQH